MLGTFFVQFHIFLGCIECMRTVATDDPVAWCVCQSVCNAPASSKNGCMVEILILFGVENPGGPRNIVLGMVVGNVAYCTA